MGMGHTERQTAGETDESQSFLCVPGRADDSFRGIVCVQPVACGIPLLQEKLETKGQLYYTFLPESEFSWMLNT